jgi:pimeloyl-ACP methyl ester carboxylesterase
MATAMAQRGCLVGVTCMPGYDRTEPWTKHPHGFTLEEILAACGGGIYALVAQSQVDIEERELTCVFHDWGCLFGLVHANRVLKEDVPSLHPKQVVLFDVCGPAHPKMQAVMKGRKGLGSLWNTVKMVPYQLFFASCFAIQKHVSHSLAEAWYSLGSLALFKILPFNPCGPLDDAQLANRHPPFSTRKLIWMMYPYYYAIRHGRSFFRQFHLPKPEDNMRVLYMFGTDKNVMFHSPGSLQYFDEQPQQQAKAIAVENAGHWLYLHQPEYCLKAVLEFCFGADE